MLPYFTITAAMQQVFQGQWRHPVLNCGWTKMWVMFNDIHSVCAPAEFGLFLIVIIVIAAGAGKGPVF